MKLSQKIKKASEKAIKSKKVDEYFNKYIKTQKRNLPTPSLSIGDRVEIIKKGSGFGTVIDTFYIDKFDKNGHEDGFILRADILPDNKEHYDSKKSCYHEEWLKKLEEESAQF